MSAMSPVLRRLEAWADTTGRESLHPIGQFVLDVIGGHHSGALPGSGTILDTRRILRLRRRSLLATVDFTRKPLLIGIVMSCSVYLLFQKSEAFELFPRFSPQNSQKTGSSRKIPCASQNIDADCCALMS